MEPGQQEVIDEYHALLARTGEERRWPTIWFDPLHDGDIHVEVHEDGTWSAVATDRGIETERARYRDLTDLMFVLCERATYAAARESVRVPPNTHSDEVVAMFVARQADLMRRIDPKWAQRIRLSHKLSRPDPREVDAAIARERRDRLIMFLVYAGLTAFLSATVALSLYLG